MLRVAHQVNIFEFTFECQLLLGLLADFERSETLCTPSHQCDAIGMNQIKREVVSALTQAKTHVLATRGLVSLPIVKRDLFKLSELSLAIDLPETQNALDIVLCLLGLVLVTLSILDGCTGTGLLSLNLHESNLLLLGTFIIFVNYSGG